MLFLIGGGYAAVHPHACGEHCASLPAVVASAGSSPRSWGALAQVALDPRLERSIPTHVGNTVVFPTWWLCGPVHPHARGEHLRCRRGIRPSRGSSPRTWGTLEWLDCLRGRGRFIPTHVGNTRPSSGPRGTMCGSSPRTWGTLDLVVAGLGALRFIPTHVGNTWPRCALARCGTVHPHARGEHINGRRVRAQKVGSSPRTWGTRRPGVVRWGGWRFIPTHVGNTPRRR